MKITTGVQFEGPDLGVQARIDGLVARFANAPRGFARAFGEALTPAVLATEPWDADYRMLSYALPKDVVRLATEDAKLIAAELANGGSRSLALELEAACLIGGLNRSAYLPPWHHAATRNCGGRDAVVYYGGLDESAARWQAAIATSGQVSSYVLGGLSHHLARLVAPSPALHDRAAIALITGARVAMEGRERERLAAAEARRVPGHDTERLIAAFTHGTLHTVSDLGEADLRSVMTRLAGLIDDGRAGDVRRFLEHFRAGCRYGGVAFADDTVARRFARGELEGELRDACARRGLDYLDYNGIFDIDRFAAKVDSAQANG